MNNKIILFLLSILMLISCNKQSAEESKYNNGKLTNSMGSVILRDEGAVPAVINNDKKEVTIEALVNGKYFNTPSRHHGIVFKGGKYGDRGLLIGLTDEREFYQALKDIGCVEGNNLTIEDMKLSKAVKGEPFNVFVTWEGLGKEIPFEDIIKSSENRMMIVRFGGNFEAAKASRTGCILCLDSCPIAITSDSSFTTAELENKKIDKYLREDIMPADGSKVYVIFRMKQLDCCSVAINND
ncbi:YdjY domain-containing protein [Brachyspira alvinipulli]|uniref:YdjY domain-containing protein n=1 Tax=Brachyspira alvinipulli TaxID=84379 RepID=UPI0004B1DC77|nr:YdjY domain-containing protein [Brachyspira alvinipulli]